MKRKWSEGYILLEALVALSILTICVFIFIHGMQVMLQQRHRQNQKMQMTRVLYQETKEVLRRGGEPVRSVDYNGRRIQVVIEEGEVDAVRAVSKEVSIEIRRSP